MILSFLCPNKEYYCQVKVTPIGCRIVETVGNLPFLTINLSWAFAGKSPRRNNNGSGGGSYCRSDGGSMAVELCCLLGFESWVCLLLTVWFVTSYYSSLGLPENRAWVKPYVLMHQTLLPGGWGRGCNPRAARVRQGRRESKSKVVQQLFIVYLLGIRHCSGRWE